MALLWVLVYLPDPHVAADNRRQQLWGSILEGLHYVLDDVELRILIVVAIAVNICTTGPVSVGLPYISSVRYNSPLALAFLLSSAAGGGLLGALLAQFTAFHHRGLVMAAGALLIGLLLIVMGCRPTLCQSCIVLLVMGFVSAIINVNMIAWIQSRVVLSVRGRVMSIVTLSSIGIAPISIAIAGLVARHSVSMMFVLAGVLIVCTALVASTMRGLRAIT